MTYKNTTYAWLFALAACIALPATAATANNDGTVSLAEAQAAGAKRFTALDPDRDGTLDAKEAKGVLTDFSAADPDKDGTVDKAEYAAQIEAAFKAADPDNDGTVDATELATPAGQKLLGLIQ
jgi:EF hand